MKVKLINTPHTYPSAIGAAICTDCSSHDRALLGAMASGHESVAEHTVFSFMIEDVSRVLLAQLTRHRIASFSVRSQRYCELIPQFVVPEGMEQFRESYLAECNRCYELYKSWVAAGVKEESARYVIPQGVVTNLVMTVNARELRHFLELRMCNRAQKEIRDLADAIYRIAKNATPDLMRNAGCGCMNGKGCPEGKKSCGRPRVSE